jgi:hypothetical protein
VKSLNVNRRHLTPEQKRDIIAALLKADPTKSDRAIAKVAKADNKTVASVRAEKERREEIPHVKSRADTKGRKQPAKKQKAAKVKLEEGEPQIDPCLKRSLESKIAEQEPIAPTASTAKSWKVEVTAKDGKRYGNGVRLKSEEEADAFRANASFELMRERGIIVTATEVIPCGDAPSDAFMKRGGNGHFTGQLSFMHGTCGTLEWEEIAGKASINPLIEAWDKASQEQRHDFVLARKVEIMKAQQQIDWAAHGDTSPDAPAPAAPADDYPDLPESLVRAPKDAAAS